MGRAGVVVACALVLGGCGGGTAPVERAESPSASAPAPEVTVPEGVRAGYVVYDRGSGKVVLRHGERRTFRSASLVKLLIVLDHLERADGVTQEDLELLRPMLRSSDDRVATVFWNRGGKGAIVERMADRIGLRDTRPPPADKPGFWGYVALSAFDLTKTYRYILEKAPRGHRELIMGELGKATPCGTDRYDQYFGIPRAAERPWAVKQGWSGFGTTPKVPCKGEAYRPAAADLGLGRPVLHTTGVVGERVVVVLTLHPADSSFKAAAERLTGLTKQVMRASG